MTLTDLLSIVAVLVSLWSWQVSKNQGIFLASRNEAFSYLDSLHSIINDIELVAENHYLDFKSNSARKYEFLILSKLYLIRSRLKALKKRGIPIQDKTLIEMRQSLTLSSGEVTNTAAVLKEIIEKSNCLREELDVEFSRVFPIHKKIYLTYKI